jgi:hypothetical protein
MDKVRDQPDVEPVHDAEPVHAPRALAGLREALGLLTPLPLSSGDMRHAARAVGWIVPLGLVIGIIWAAAFRVSWRLYGETANMRVLPALVIVLIECLLTGPFLALGLARTMHLLTSGAPTRPAVDDEEPLSPVGSLALGLTILAQWVLLVSVPTTVPWYPSHTDWRHHFAWMYPAPVYRPLVLAPLWGRWAILLAASIGRTSPRADGRTIALCEAVSPARLLGHLVLPMALTAIYCSRDRNLLTGAIIGLLVFAATYVVAMAIARRGGGQTRHSLFASAQVAQLSFLMLYRAFWPLIHG